jgi:hypothetical protein
MGIIREAILNEAVAAINRQSVDVVASRTNGGHIVLEASEGSRYLRSFQIVLKPGDEDA